MTQDSPRYSDPQVRASELWLRFRGIFGGDALDRKFGPVPPPEWIAVIARLSDYEVERGLRRLVYSGKAHVLTLPEFARLCRELANDADANMPRQASLPNPVRWTGDSWDISANLRFWKYCTHRLCGSFRPWGEAWTQEHADCTRIALAYVHAWAQDMREHCDPVTGELCAPSQDYQTRAFADCMRRAEADIATHRSVVPIDAKIPHPPIENPACNRNRHGP